VADPLDSQNQYRYRVYWDDPSPELAPVFTNPNAVATDGMKFANVEGGGMLINQRTLKYLSLVSQSVFFDEKLAITASIRRDDVRGDFLPVFQNLGAAGNYKNVMGYGGANVHLLRHSVANQKSFGVVTYPFPKHYLWLSRSDWSTITLRTFNRFRAPPSHFTTAGKFIKQVRVTNEGSTVVPVPAVSTPVRIVNGWPD